MDASTETVLEMETSLGERLKQLRLARGLDQRTLAERAGIGDRSLRNLENGLGSNLKTLLAVVRALGREDWLKTIAPVATINPLQLTREATARKRAPRRNKREA